MRQDIAKVLVTRPRYGGGRGKKVRTGHGVGLATNDNLPAREGIRQRHKQGWDTMKGLNEYLSPLRRFINGKVGHRWDNVYSEIRELIKPGNTIHEHILEHVDGYLCINVVADPDSKTGMASHYALGNRKGSRYAIRAGELYVDPADGIIKRAKNLRKEKAKTPRPVTHLELAKDIVAVQVHGIWYAVSLKAYEERRRFVTQTSTWGGREHVTTREVISYIVDGRHVDRLNDHIAHEVEKAKRESTQLRAWGGTYYAERRVFGNTAEQLRAAYGRPGVFGVGKRQLSHKELIRLGLTNTPIAKAA